MANVTFETLGNTLGKYQAKSEAAVQARLDAMGDNPSTTDMLVLQQDVQRWSMSTQLSSSLVKELGDVLKGVIQKAV